MKFYIDTKYHCHATNSDGNFREVEDKFFDGKCTTFIEGYIHVPSDESLTLDDGTVIYGKMFTPFKSSSKLEDAQREYERQKLVDAENALAILLGGEST